MIIKPGMVFKTSLDGGYYQYFLGIHDNFLFLYRGTAHQTIESYSDPVYVKVSYLHLEFPDSIVEKLWYKRSIESKRWKIITRAHYASSRLQYATNEAETSAEMQSQNEDFSVETTD